MSFPAWGAWIEIVKTTKRELIGLSLPAWGAWIEMDVVSGITNMSGVAPRMGSVD